MGLSPKRGPPPLIKARISSSQGYFRLVIPVRFPTSHSKGRQNPV